MITLKLGSYTRKDCALLSDLLHDTANELCTKEGTNGRCNLCPVRKVCNDLASASQFARVQCENKHDQK